MPIQFIGLINFSKLESGIIRGLAQEYYDKFLRDVKDILLVISLKKYDQKETKCKYSFHSRVESGSTVLLTSEASDWDLKRTLHKLFQKLEKGIQHKYKLKGNLPKH